MSQNKLTENSYEFKVSVEKRKTSIKTPIAEKRGGGSHYDGDLVILIPDVGSTNFTRFMLAHYSEYPNELPTTDHEFIGLFPYPVNAHSRLSFDCESPLHDGLHFIVMSEKVEEIMLAHLIGKEIALCIEPESYDLDQNIDI